MSNTRPAALLLRLAVAVALCVSLQACGGSELDDDFDAADEADATPRYDYLCKLSHEAGGNESKQDAHISLRGNKAKWGFTKAKRDANAAVPLNPSYQSRGSRKYVQFKGPINGGTVAVRVEPELRTGGYKLHNGATGGYGAIDFTIDWYESWTGICYRE